MVNSFSNPYMNPYGQQFQSYQQVLPQQQVVRVNGENGARAYAMGANSSALLLDESGKIVWLKTTDGAGFATVTPYDVTPHQIERTPDFSSLETRVKRLEELINEHANDSSATSRKTSKSSNASASSVNTTGETSNENG